MLPKVPWASPQEQTPLPTSALPVEALERHLGSTAQIFFKPPGEAQALSPNSAPQGRVSTCPPCPPSTGARDPPCHPQDCGADLVHGQGRKGVGGVGWGGRHEGVEGRQRRAGKKCRGRQLPCLQHGSGHRVAPAHTFLDAQGVDGPVPSVDKAVLGACGHHSLVHRHTGRPGHMQLPAQLPDKGEPHGPHLEG